METDDVILYDYEGKEGLFMYLRHFLLHQEIAFISTLNNNRQKTRIFEAKDMFS